ncbi:hypothetical protein AMEX_G18069, partial [Astyanax mexicanus]
ILKIKHDNGIIERKLKCLLRSARLSRRKDYSSLNSVLGFIRAQLQSSGQLHGYRWMYAKCRLNGYRVRKEDVRLILKESRICINGCIDGFSRKLVWLNAYTTSSDPRLVGGYYIEAVQRLGGGPAIVRGDFGTENGHVCDFQRFFRRNHHESTESYLDRASTANQRIESWLRFLRKECLEFWITLFVNLKDRGIFDGGFLEKSLIQFCCMGLIQDELDDTAEVWDSHIIRPSKNDNVPSGRPNAMYALPGLCRTTDFLTPIEDDDIQTCKTECTFRQSVPCDPDVYDLCNIIMAESQLTLPRDAYKAIDLYIFLRNYIKATL